MDWGGNKVPPDFQFCFGRRNYCDNEQIIKKNQGKEPEPSLGNQPESLPQKIDENKKDNDTFASTEPSTMTKDQTRFRLRKGEVLHKPSTRRWQNCSAPKDTA
jgi:hypothetical protein